MLRKGQAMMGVDDTAQGIRECLRPKVPCLRLRGHDARTWAEHGEEKTVMIDATYLKAHRTATSMAAKKGSVAV